MVVTGKDQNSHIGKVAAFFSLHQYTSKRKAGFHWLAKAYRSAGWEVLFITVGYSWLSHLAGKTVGIRASYNQWFQADDGVWCFLWRPLFHPVNLRARFFNDISGRLFRYYSRLPMKEIESRVSRADQIVVESSAAVMLLERLRRLNPNTHFVYRVSDDTEVIGSHPIITAEEHRLAPLFDLISIPSPILRSKFSHCENVRVLKHGIDLNMLSDVCENPYKTKELRQVLSLGTTLFDHEAASTAAREFPDWNFHFFGDLKFPAELPNMHNHGEVSFAELKPYLAHADIGAAFYRNKNGAEYLVDTSNKIAQYALAKLPIVCPLKSPAGRNDLFTYQPGDIGSLKAAFIRAANADRTELQSPNLKSWEEVAQEIMAE